MKLRMGVIGAGIMGEMHSRAYAEYPTTELVAVCDVVGERAASLAKKWGVKSWYRDYAEMLDKEDLDAVAIATPDHLHRGVSVDCLEAGKHVLLEKPLATTLQDGEAIAQVVRETGKIFMVNHGLRQKPAIRLVKDAVSSGELGKIKHVLSTHHWRLRGPTETISWAEHTSLATFLLSHTVDLVRWWLGEEIVEVFALETRGLLESLGKPTHDTLAALAKFESGATFSMEASWIYPNAHISFGDVVYNVLGDKGVMRFDHLAQGLEKATDLAEVMVTELQSSDYAGRATGWWYDSVHYFVDSVLAGQHPTPTVQDGLHVLKVVSAMLQSVREGNKVTIEYDS
jgi:predicted dehydrogenase